MLHQKKNAAISISIQLFAKASFSIHMLFMEKYLPVTSFCLSNCINTNDDLYIADFTSIIDMLLRIVDSHRKQKGKLMINTYEGYLRHPAGAILTIEDAQAIYAKLAACVSKFSDEDITDYWNSFLSKAAKYTNKRNEWETMTLQERRDSDKGRSLMHDDFITSLNILSRIADKEGIDTSWRDELGDERKRIGDFACFVTYITGISNR